MGDFFGAAAAIGTFIAVLVGFSNRELSRRVSAAPAVSALWTASVCLAAHKAIMPNGSDRVIAKYVGKACVYLCREMRRPATTNRSGNGGKI